MQAFIEDIELDVQDLKCVLQAFEAHPTAAVRLVARRNIKRLQERLDALLQQLDEVAVDAAAGMPKTEPVVETAKPVEPLQTSVSQSASAESDKEVARTKVADVVAEAAVSHETKEPEHTVSTSILAEKIRPAADLRHGISLNDSFRFTRELFHGDSALMNDTLGRLGEASSLDEAMQIFSSASAVSDDNEAAADFVELLKKYFS